MPPNQHLRRTPSSASSASAGTASNQQSAADLYQIDSSSSPLTSTEALHILQSLFGRLPAPLENPSSSSDALENDMTEPSNDQDLMPPAPATMHASFSGAVRSPFTMLSTTHSTSSSTTAPMSVRVWPQATSFYQSPPPQRILAASQPNHDDIEEGLSIDGDEPQSDPIDNRPWYMDLPVMPDLLGSSSSSFSADTHAQLDHIPPSSATSTTMRARIPPPAASDPTSRPAVPSLTREPSDATTTSGFSSSDLNPPPPPAGAARLGLGIQHIRAPAVPAVPASSSSASTSAAADALASTVFELRVARMTLAALSAAARARQIERECSWYSADGDEGQPMPGGQDEDDSDSDDDDEEDEVEEQGTGSGRSSRMSMRSSAPGSAAGSRSASPFTTGAARLTRATSPGSPLRAETTAEVIADSRPAPAAVRQVVVNPSSSSSSSPSSSSSSAVAAPSAQHPEPPTARHTGWMSRPPVASAWASSSSSTAGAAARSAARRKRVAEMMLNEMRGGTSSAAASSNSSIGGKGKKAVLVRVRKIKPVVVRMVGEHGVGIGEGCMM